MGRSDGRSEDQIRNVKITRPFMKFAEGSCLIELGNTKVICTASVEESVPPFLKNTGNGWVTAEYGMLPRSCQSRIPRGKDSGRTYEIQRLVGRALRSVTNMRAIGERTVWLDCDVLQGDGGTRTAAITGAFIALIDSLDSIRKRGWIQAIPVSDFVAATSVGIINGVPMLDLAYDEDSKADVDMNIVMTARGRFIEIQGTAERKPFTGEQMNSLLKLAQKGIGELVDIQRNILKDVFRD